MPNTFYAFCPANDETRIFRIPITAGIQGELERLFESQEQLFMSNRNDEVEFNGDWNPEPNQLLTINDENLARPFTNTFRNNPAAYDQLDIRQIENAGIKGIFTHSNSMEPRTNRTIRRILLQRFQTSQYLQKRGRFTLTFSNEQFGKFSDQGFVLDTKLTAIVEQSLFKFESFSNLRTIIPIQSHFLEATADEVNLFRQCDLFVVQDENYFNNAMDEGSRKIIRRITGSNVLDNYDVSEIQDRATRVGLEIEMRDEKLLLPNDKPRIRRILRFLDESVYKGAFSDETFETNSKRRI